MSNRNNLSPSSHAKCSCGRMSTIGEWKSGIGITGGYKCPDCIYRKPLTREEYYKSFNMVKPSTSS